MANVEIYYFKGWDQVAGEDLNSRRPGTPDAIRRVGGEMILETRRLVDSGDLDDNGFLKVEAVIALAAPVFKR
jgi:hypothetical protein